MRVTNGEVWVAWEPLQKLLNEKLPVKVSYRLARLSHKLGDQYKIVDGVRNGLIVKHGTTDDRGQVSINQASSTWPEFAREYDELMMEEVDLDTGDMVILPDQDLNIDAITLLALEKWVGLPD